MKREKLYNTRNEHEPDQNPYRRPNATRTGKFAIPNIANAKAEEMKRQGRSRL
jgi:hypothetical protein